MIWQALYVTAGTELHVAAALKARGLSAVVPWEMITVRRVKQGRPYIGERRIALLPRYVFAARTEHDPSWRRLSEEPGSLRHLRGIAHIGSRAIVLSDAEVDQIRRMVPDGVERPRRRSLRPGDRVRLLTGPFASFESVLEAIGRDGVRVTVELFGRQTPLVMSPEAVEVV